MKNKDDSWIRRDLNGLGCSKTQSREGTNENDGDSEKDDRKRKHYDLVQSWDGGRTKPYIAEKDETLGKKLGKKKERELETNFNGLSSKKPRTMRNLRKLNSDSNETPRGIPNHQEVIEERLETDNYKRPIRTQ